MGALRATWLEPKQPTEQTKVLDDTFSEEIYPEHEPACVQDNAAQYVAEILPKTSFPIADFTYVRAGYIKVIGQERKGAKIVRSLFRPTAERLDAIAAGCAEAFFNATDEDLDDFIE